MKQWKELESRSSQTLKPEELQSTFEEIFHVENPEYWIKAGSEMLPLPSLTDGENVISGSPTMTDRPMTPVMSSIVMGRAVKGNKLYIQFHSNPAKVYKYMMATPVDALEAFEDITRSSPGRWVWKNIRGSKLGPVFGDPSKQTIGGTIASLIPYDKMTYSRTGIEEVPDYEKISKQMQEFKMGVKGMGEGPTSGEPFTVKEIEEFQRQKALDDLRKMLKKQAGYSINFDFIPIDFEEITGMTTYYIGRLEPLQDLPTYDFVSLSEFNELKTDFSKDFSVLHGPIVRDGEYKYLDKEGNDINLVKDWDNIKDIYSRYDYLVIKGTPELGAHYADEIGFAYNFIPNEDMHTIDADLVLIEDIEDLTDVLNPEKGYHVSPGYHDVIEGNIQIIKDLDHVAISLANKEEARACTGTNEKGCSCTTVKIKNYDQNRMEVVN